MAQRKRALIQEYLQEVDFPTLPSEVIRDLEPLITSFKVVSVIAASPNDKSLRSDGFSNTYYKKFSHVLFKLYYYICKSLP